MTNKRELPFEVIVLASYMVPHLRKILEEFDLSAEQLSVLMYIKHSGRDYGKGKIILREDISYFLKNIYGISPSQISKMLRDLEERDLLGYMRLNSIEKNELFGTKGGRRTASFLLEHGLSKIDEFAKKINSFYMVATRNMPSQKLDVINQVLKIFARDAERALYKSSRED